MCYIDREKEEEPGHTWLSTTRRREEEKEAKLLNFQGVWLRDRWI